VWVLKQEASQRKRRSSWDQHVASEGVKELNDLRRHQLSASLFIVRRGLHGVYFELGLGWVGWGFAWD